MMWPEDDRDGGVDRVVIGSINSLGSLTGAVLAALTGLSGISGAFMDPIGSQVPLAVRDRLGVRRPASKKALRARKLQRLARKARRRGEGS